MANDGDAGPVVNDLGKQVGNELPTGTLTFVLTDIEGSTKLWDDDPLEMAAALQLHDALITEAVAAHGGSLVRSKGEGDSTFSVFPDPVAAVAAAEAMRDALQTANWPTPTPIRARIGVLTGVAELRDGDYYGSAVNRAARVRSLADGGEILLAASTYTLVADSLLRNRVIEDRGEHELRGLQRPERVYALRDDTTPRPVAATAGRRRVPTGVIVGSVVAAALIVGLIAFLVTRPAGHHAVTVAPNAAPTTAAPAAVVSNKPSVEISSVELVSTPTLVRYEVTGVSSRVKSSLYQIRILARSPAAADTWLWSDPVQVGADGRWTGALNVPVSKGATSLRVSAIVILPGPVSGVTVSGPPGASTTVANTIADPLLAQYEQRLTTRGPADKDVIAASTARPAN